MGMKTLETAILAELRVVAKSRKIRLKDIMEWSTSPVGAQAGEVLYYLPGLGIHCAVRTASPAEGGEEGT